MPANIPITKTTERIIDRGNVISHTRKLTLTKAKFWTTNIVSSTSTVIEARFLKLMALTRIDSFYIDPLFAFKVTCESNCDRCRHCGVYPFT